MVVGHGGLARQGLDDRAGQGIGGGQDLLAGAQRAHPDQHGHLGPLVEDPGGALQAGGVGDRAGAEEGGGGRRGAGRADRRPRLGVGRGHLEVVGEAEVADRAAGQAGPHGPVNQGRDRARDREHHVAVGQVHEHPVQVDLLLVAGAEHGRLLHAGDRQHRGVVQLGVVQAVEQVEAAGAGGGQADPDPAGRLGVAGGHERGRLLVVDEYEPDLVLVAAQPLHDPVDPVAGQAEHGVHTPLGQPLDQQFGRDLVHADPQDGEENQ
jgi:hypothetical protein